MTPQVTATATVSTTTAQPVQHIDTAALADTNHPDHHVALGRFIGLALLGLTAYSQAQSKGATIFLDPVTTGQYLQAFKEIWSQQ